VFFVVGTVSTTTFNQLTGSNPAILIPQYSTASTTGFGAFGDFLNVPYLLSTRVPFAYFYQIATILSTLASSSSAYTVPSAILTINIPIRYGISTTTVNVDMFSTTTIRYYLSQSWIDLLRGIMVAVVYASTGLFLFRRVKNLQL